MKLLISLVCLSSVLLISNAQFPYPIRPLGARNDCTNPSKSYCMNEKQYVLCAGAEGAPDTPAILTCPIDGEFCTHDTPSSCSTTLKTTNTQCNQCLTGNALLTTGHACLSFTSFRICALGVPTGDEKFCSPGLYCDVFHPNRENPCRRYTGQQMLCWKEYKPPPPPSAADICETLNEEGNHEFEDDIDCTKYRACSKHETTGVWSGIILDCPANSFYDPKIRICVPPVIYKCIKTPPAPPAQRA